MKHALILLLAGLAAADDTTLLVQITDVATGKPVATTRCALLDGATGKRYAQFEGATYRGDRRPNRGDVLCVYARGYDLIKRPIRDPSVPLVVELKPAKATSEIVAEGLQEACKIDVKVLPTFHDSDRARALHDFYRFTRSVTPTNNTISLVVPAGMRVNCYLFAQVGYVWPTYVVAKPGGRQTIRRGGLRSVPLVLDFGVQVPQADAMRITADRGTVPHLDPKRIDAVKSYMNRPVWWGVESRKGRVVLSGLPAVPLHVFLRVGGKPVYRMLQPDAEVLDLRASVGGSKRLRVLPRLDGRRPEPQSLVAPGRLDLLTIVGLKQKSLVMMGAFYEVSSGALPERVALPAADWLTVWSPRRGLAHVRWPDSGVPEGKYYPGSVSIHFPSDMAGDAKAFVFPMWFGAGQVKIWPPDLFLAREAPAGTDRIDFHGLAPGQYACSVSFDMKGDGALTKKYHYVVVKDGTPHVDVRVQPH